MVDFHNSKFVRIVICPFFKSYFCLAFCVDYRREWFKIKAQLLIGWNWVNLRVNVHTLKFQRHTIGFWLQHSVWIEFSVEFWVFPFGLNLSNVKLRWPPNHLKKSLFTIFLWGEELYTQMGFFVQSNLTVRSIHRREMWVVSLKNCSSVENKIKKIFLISLFLKSYRGLKFCVNTGCLAWFCSVLV